MFTRTKDARGQDIMRPLLAATILTALAYTLGGAAEEEPLHFISALPTTAQPLSPAALTLRIENAALQVAAYAPIPRVAFFDIAYPATRAEAQKLQGHALVLITALSQNAAEFPLKSAYVIVDGQRIDLRRLASVQSRNRDEDRVSRTFGPHRVDCLYLLPLAAAAPRAALLIDFAANRDGFNLGEFTGPPPAVVPEGVPGGDPPPDALAAFIRREYPGFLAK